MRAAKDIEKRSLQDFHMGNVSYNGKDEQMDTVEIPSDKQRNQKSLVPGLLPHQKQLSPLRFLNQVSQSYNQQLLSIMQGQNVSKASALLHL